MIGGLITIAALCIVLAIAFVRSKRSHKMYDAALENKETAHNDIKSAYKEKFGDEQESDS